MDKAKQKIFIIYIVSYVLATIFSYVFFANVIYKRSGKVAAPISESSKLQDGKTVFADTLPKTEECPITGELYSKPQKQWWEKHRPLGVMIENHEESRPQSGLSSSDVVYEAVAEGGITRFLAVYYCQDAGMVGPVRSARTYFVDFISEYADYPIYAHVGGANCNAQTGSGCANGAKADAIGQIASYGWANYNDLNGVTNVGFPTMWRDYDRLGHEVATEHTMYSTTAKLWEFAAKNRKLTNVTEDGEKWDIDFRKYKFKDDESASKRPESQVISFNFWDNGNYAVKWEYDKKENKYLRINGGQKHLDKNSDTQLSAKNIVILFMREGRANDGYEGNLHMLYGTKGTGDAVVFSDGVKTEATWSKKNRTARTIITDSSGKEIAFTRGNIWFEILGTGTDILVE